jgi:1,4-alpha-glucan branching enzyme
MTVGNLDNKGPGGKPGKAVHPRRLAEDYDDLLAARESDPFRLLGPHWIDRDGEKALAIRTIRPDASGLSIAWARSGAAGAAIFPAAEIDDQAGLFESVIPAATLGLRGDEAIAPTDYRLRFLFPDGATFETYDAYAFPPILTEYDLYLSGEGTHYLNYEKLGSHVREVAGVSGVEFAVWAPNAKRVSVVGNFNSWDGRVAPMRSRGATGIWEIFLPGLTEGALYKFEIFSRVAEHLGLKSDPYAFASEMRPKTASVVTNIDRYQWSDSAWLTARASRD